MSSDQGAAKRGSLRDLKEALSSSRKPDITHARTPLLNYNARGCEYGNVVYQRANYLRPVAPEGYTGTPTAADFERARGYLRALVSHAVKTLDAMEHHQAMDPDLLDVEGMKRAVFAADEDASETATRKGIGPSYLPHLAHVASSLNMALAQAVACGLLPADPGRPWEEARAREAELEAPMRRDAVLLRCQETHDFSTDPLGVRMQCVLEAGHGLPHLDVSDRWWA